MDSAVTLIFGPHEGTQALYYTTFANGGQVRRIAFVGSANHAPVAIGNATPTNGRVPLAVAFSGNESSDPDGDPLHFEWDFDDGTPPVGAGETAHLYGTAGIFIARLRVDDGRGGTDTTSVRIDPGHAPPEVRITSPAPGTLFRVGQAITLHGHAVDEAGLALPDAALRWSVRLHHDTHTHPFLDPTAGNGIVIVTPAPEDLPATTTSFLEVRLSATDARGLSQTITRELRPRLVRLRFDTRPRGLRLRIQGNDAARTEDHRFLARLSDPCRCAQTDQEREGPAVPEMVRRARAPAYHQDALEATHLSGILRLRFFHNL